MLTFGKYIKAIRISKNFKLSELAKGTKINISVLSRIERDERIPTVNQVLKIADFYKVPDEVLINEFLSDKIVTLISERNNFMDILNTVKTKIEMKNHGKKYFVQKSGKDDFIIYHLIQADSYNMLDVFFSTLNEAKEYAKKNNLEIIDNEEN